MEPTVSATTTVQPILSHAEIVGDLDKLLTSLNKLTPYEIAELLQKNGIRGKRREAQQCPVAYYIKSECAWAETVMVCPNIVSAYPATDFYKDTDYPTAVTLKHYENVNNFIQNFDSGYYTFLLTQD